jgi:hypothetical protein
MFTRVVGLNAYLGYAVNFANGRLISDTVDDESHLQNNNEDAVHLDWSGVRASAGLTFMFLRKVTGR